MWPINIYMGKKIFVQERHSKILEYIAEKNRADVEELATILSVTEATIRRDLDYLERKGLLYRTHGGALKREQASIWQTSSLQDRMIMHIEEKKRIAQFVIHLIHDGESIMIDGGSTTLLAAKELCIKKNLLIVTNAPSIGETMIDANNHKIILTGGELLKGTYSLIGSAAEHSISQYRTDKAIIGMSGILVDQGYFSAIPEEAEIKRLMSFNSRETIVISDSSKIGTRAFCFVCDFSHVNKLVTDKNISASALEDLKKQGVEVFTV